MRNLIIKSGKCLYLLLCVLGIYLSTPFFSFAGNFKVSPVKIFFAPNERTASITIKNMGDEKVNLQLNIVKWAQDENGKDIYEDSGDIIIFPKIFTVEKDAERILRLGYKSIEPSTFEKTYRIFIEELPVIKPGEKALKFNLRVNIPVFIDPLQKRKESTIEKVALSNGNLEVHIRNSGNTHIFVNRLVIGGVDNTGKDVFTKEVNGWYTLMNKARTYIVPLDENNCRKAGAIRVVAEMDKSSMSYTLKDYVKTQCVKNESKSVSDGEDNN